MTSRAPQHLLEEQSVIHFSEKVVAAGWVYRIKTHDYGIDGEIEIFNADGSTTGLSVNVQLRATGNAASGKKVVLKVKSLAYYRSFDVPTVVVRYDSTHNSFFWQWASNIKSRVEIAEGQKTVTYRFGDDERWTDETPIKIRRTLEVRRNLANFPPNIAVPLRIDLSAIPVAARYPIDRLIAHAIANSHGALTRAGNTPANVEAFTRLEPEFLTVGIDTLNGVTLDLLDPTPEDYLASILYALVHLFSRLNLVRQAEALAWLIAEQRLQIDHQRLAFDACSALSGDLPALVKLAIDNDLHADGPMQAMIARVIAKAPKDDESRRIAMNFSSAQHWPTLKPQDQVARQRFITQSGMHIAMSTI